MIDCFINGALILVGLGFLYVIVLVFVQGINAINKEDKDED
jgi:hypothetical protein